MSNKHPLRVQSHILRLLGDQLIGHDRLAVFELVKNSYDADASTVSITIELNNSAPCIKVEDNGSGMNLSVITGAWLEVGTDSKRTAQNRKRSKIFNRLPLGEKGVGRLAVQKLGKKLQVITKEEGSPEYEFWRFGTRAKGNVFRITGPRSPSSICQKYLERGWLTSSMAHEQVIARMHQ
ncbi:hypothetical protein CUN63_05170 [Pseudomonas sp. ACM7]|nr:hypothetical protein CUN63_05170 [Pseudomonas sp. ACM7]